MSGEDYWGAISWALCHMGEMRSFMETPQYNMEGSTKPMQVVDNVLLDWWYATNCVTQRLGQHPQYTRNIVVDLLLEIVSMRITEAFELYRNDPLPEHTTAWRILMKHLARCHRMRCGMRPWNITKWSNGWTTMDFTADAHWPPCDNIRIDFQWVNDDVSWLNNV